MDFWFDMISKRSAPNVVTYTIVIDGLCKNSEIDNALYFLHCIWFLKGMSLVVIYHISPMTYSTHIGPKLSWMKALLHCTILSVFI